jgi:hypothetical protein
LDHLEISDRFAASLGVFRGLLESVSPEQARWKPSPQKWSILEVTNHLYEEEYLDFRLRVEFTLFRSGETWPPWDPVGSAVERRYNERDFVASRNELFAEREKSIEWLRGLESPDWNRFYSHPTIGDLRAGDLLAAWLAHDYLHLRQLANLQVDYTRDIVDPYDIRYAAP